MTASLLDAEYEIPVEHLGPVWEPNPDWDGVSLIGRHGKYVLPELSLGHQAIAWAQGYPGSPLYEGPYLLSPDSTDELIEPFTLTFEQWRFVIWWYAIDDEGNFIYRRGVLQRLKGHGKDPLAAFLSLVELLGPCRFAGWAARPLEKFGTEPDGSWVVDTGDPVATENPNAWIQIAAVTKFQPLALDTPVRTLRGWTTVGELHTGDSVFASDGRPVRVARETEIMQDMKCYRLSFADGESVVASATHGWTVEGRNGHDDGFVKQTLSTEELAERWNSKRWRYRIPLVPALTEDVDLALSPYMLGLWLGDGSSADSTIAIDWRVRDEVAAIIEPHVEPHEEVVWANQRGNAGTLRVRTRRFVCPRGHDYSKQNYAIQSGNKVCRRCIHLGKAGRAAIPKIPTFREKLRAIGVLGNKHIPDSYLFAGTQQRLELLRGLMDSDGAISPSGRANFTNINSELIAGVCDLLSSLGIRYNVQDVGNGAQRVFFTPWAEMNPFHLGHKAARVRTERRFAHRSIVGVEEVASVPVKCIGIDTDDHLFQVGRTGILTHNTQNTMQLFPGLISERLMRKAHMRQDSIGITKVTAFRGRRQIQAVTSNPRALEGGRPSFVIKNETEHWVETNNGWLMDQAIDRNAAKSKGGAARSLAICNAPDYAEESVGLREREAYLKEMTGLSVKTGVLYDSLELPESVSISPPGFAEMDEETQEAAAKAWLEACIRTVRGDSWWLNETRIALEILDRKVPSTSVARRFYFNQTVANEDSWVDGKAVSAAIDVLAQVRRTSDADQARAGWDIVRPDEPIVMFFDGSKSDDATGLVGCRISDGYCFTIGVWQAPPQKRARTQWLVPRSEVDARVEEAFERFTVVGFWADPSHTKDDEDGSAYWDGLIDEWHRRYKSQLQIWSTKTGQNPHSIMWDMASPMRSKMFTEAAEQTKAELEHVDPDTEELTPVFTIDGHPRLIEHLRNARRAPGLYGVSLRKESRESLRKIDLAVCLVGARMLRRVLLNSEPEEAPKGGWAFSV